MLDYEFEELLKRKKLLDSLQYYYTCEFQLESAEISYKALIKILDDFTISNEKEREKMLDKLSKEKKATIKSNLESLQFFGQSISIPMAIDKLTDEIMSLLHNFCDVFAQWINSVLFGELAIPICSVSLARVIKKTTEFPEYSGDFIEKLKELTKEEFYKYISDYNNTSKHRYHIGTEISYNILNGDSSSMISEFEKEISHPNKNLTETLRKGIELYNNILKKSRSFIEEYYEREDNNYITHRIYNPSTLLQFQNQEDFNNGKVYMHMYYIDVDPDNILPEYHIMLIHDDNEKISSYNSVYNVVALRDKKREGASFIGCLVPEDSDSYKLSDYHYLRYRKYITKQQDYIELYKEMNNREFKIYPLLSYQNILILPRE